MKALYIHIPFCKQICIYCDFYKMKAKRQEQTKYIDYLIKEINLRQDIFNYQEVNTVYLGGGSPSSLDLIDLERLLDALANVIDFNKVIEFTIECNPIDINNDFVKLLCKYHINRVSLGVQSLDDNKLMFLQRLHKKTDVFKAIDLLHYYNINNINCDLIYGLENDNISLIKSEIDELLNHDVRHLSLYTLIIENKTILARFIKNGYKPLSDEKERKIYDFVNSYLKTKNFIHYETSNYALPNYQSIHNLTYWNNDNYYGLGVNASYYVDNIRYTNPNTLAKYYKSIDNYPKYEYSSFEVLSKNDQIYEEIMLGLRKAEGISVNKLNQKFNMDIFKRYPKIVELINQKIMKYENDFLYVDDNYSYLLNSILIKIFEE